MKLLRAIAVVLIVFAIGIAYPEGNPPSMPPPSNVCGETVESGYGEIIIDMTPCSPDPEQGVPSWKSITT